MKMILKLQRNIFEYQKQIEGWLTQCKVRVFDETCEVVFENHLIFTGNMNKNNNMISLKINGQQRAYYSNTLNWIDRVEEFIEIYVNHIS
jgi:hypothetical protein